MFERERRYVVVKINDAVQVLTSREQDKLGALAEMVGRYRASIGKAPLDAFVVEADWPEFPIVIDMVRRRMEGEPTREAELLKDYAERLADWQRNCGELKQERDMWFTKATSRMLEIGKMKEAIGLHLTYHERGCAYLDEFAPDNIEHQGPDAESAVTFNARQPGMQTIRDLSMLVKQLCRALAKVDNPNGANKGLYIRALDYLKRKGLQGSPLREDHADNSQLEETHE